MNGIMGKKKYKIVNRFKFMRFIIILVSLVLIIILFFQKRNKAYSSLYEEQYIEIEITKGDTIWDIAREFMPKEYDIRKMVFEIKEINNMDNAKIYPGDSVKVPIK